LEIKNYLHKSLAVSCTDFFATIRMASFLAEETDKIIIYMLSFSAKYMKKEVLINFWGHRRSY